MKKVAYLFAIASLVLHTSCKKDFASTISNIEWSKVYGGSGLDLPFSAAETPDGGFVVVGYTKSNDGDVTGNHCSTGTFRGQGQFITCGLEDAWVVKINASGNKILQHVYGGAPGQYIGYGADRRLPTGYVNSDRATSVLITGDGCMIAGQTNSNVNDFSGTNPNAPSYKWLLKMGYNGDSLWSSVLYKKNSNQNLNINDSVSSILPAVGTVKGYLLSGVTNDPANSSTGGSLDANLTLVNETGALIWEKFFGGKGNDKFNSVIKTIDNCYLAVGQTTSMLKSSESLVTGSGGFNILTSYTIQHGAVDLWVTKILNNGNLFNTAVTSGFRYEIPDNIVLGGEGMDIANAVVETLDSGFMIAGQTSSNDGDVSGNHSSNYDAWIVKLDKKLKVQWKKTYGGAFGDDMAKSIVQTNDGNFIIAGQTSSNDGDVSGNHGYSDAWVFKIDKEGKLLWQQTIGGSGADGATNAITTSDGGVLVTGYSFSNNGDVSETRGYGGDFWVVKLKSQ